ncbi:MAG TPA: RagB/SusD family nutrient uptake outer membrane protein, partial [Chitinophagaceae bacterium]|nr:RagB/SusD family nutrient uptake outer membrane protein [Chitinophagaceae bacterium]
VDERITKGTVKGLRARIALYRGGYSLRQQTKTMERRSDYLTYYQIARDECNDIMTSNQHSLNPDYKALWKNGVGTRIVADPQGELMFQVGSIGGVSAEDSRLGFYDGPSVNGQGNRAINMLPTYFYLFDSMDVRRDVTIAAYNVGADGKTKVNLGSSGTSAASVLNTGKYRRDWNAGIAPTYTGQFLSLKWQILRYSDVLLMFAEAENEINGPTTQAYNAVNMIRRRGFGKPITAVDATVDLPVGLSKAAFFDYLVRERSLELGGEGVRKYDLLRWNRLATALAETKNNLEKLAIATAMNPVTYMAPQPTYVLTNQLPVSMLFRNNSTSEDASLWANSFYKPAPTATPTGTTRVAWINAPTSTAPRNAIGTVNADRFASGFKSGRSELFPIPQPARDANFNLSQNPGY